MNSLMTHMIPWYPSREGSLEVAKGMLEGGTTYLEVQFPFSDPTADGPVIEAACTKALAGGFTVDGGFEFVKEITAWQKEVGNKTTIFIMSYASLVYARGIARFVADAKSAGAQGLIVPDLPADSDEGLYEACKKAGLHPIPVLVPHISEARLTAILNKKLDYVYCALRSGITGANTKVDTATLDFLTRAGQKGSKILAGFGIKQKEHVRGIAQNVHASIIGSALVSLTDATISKDLRKKIAEAVQDLGS